MEPSISKEAVEAAGKVTGEAIHPGLGEIAATTLADPPAGLIVAAGSGYQALKTNADETDGAAKALDQSGLQEHRQAVEEIWKIWDNVRQEVLKYNEAVKTAGEDNDPQASRLELVKAISAAQTEANIKALEEQQRITIEWMKSHGASPEQIAAAEHSNRQQIDSIRNNAAAQSIDQLQKDVTSRKEQQKNLDSYTANQDHQVGQAAVTLKNALDTQKKAGDEMARRATARDSAEGDLNDAREDPILGGQPREIEDAMQRDHDAKVRQAEATLKGAIDDYQEAKGKKEKADADVQRAEDKQNAAILSRDKAREAGIENRKRIKQEESEVNIEKGVQGLTGSSKSTNSGSGTERSYQAVRPDESAKKDLDGYMLTIGQMNAGLMQAIRDHSAALKLVAKEIEQLQREAAEVRMQIEFFQTR